ncbi:MAG: DUF4062 domain-containing protein [Candidatus Riflebacteria bacterium]|nr:DUF4062 domain-containing protein [Candidatus Riflebacteria bacterium]
MPTKVYHAGKSTISLEIGDLCQSSAEVLVSSDDVHLSMGGGISMAIARAAGPQFPLDVHKHLLKRPPRLGDVIVTTSGNLGSRYIFHGITFDETFQNKGLDPRIIIRRIVETSLHLMEELGCRSIAFPCIGMGLAEIPRDEVATEMGTTLVRHLLDHPVSLSIEIYVFDKARDSPQFFLDRFEDEVKKTLGVDHGAAGFGKPTDLPGRETHRGQASELYNILKALDDRRQELENELLATNPEKGPTSQLAFDAIKDDLAQIGQIRDLFLPEVRPPRKPDPDRGFQGSRVFVSSTGELTTYRRIARREIERNGATFLGMEDFAAASHLPIFHMLKILRSADYYFGILGWRYGSLDPISKLSYTQIEYTFAGHHRIPRYMFLMSPAAPITIRMTDENPELTRRIRDFRDTVGRHQLFAQFKNGREFQRQLALTMSAR